MSEEAEGLLFPEGLAQQVRQSNALAVQLAQVRSTERSVVMTRWVAVAVVVGQHEDHVRPPGGLGGEADAAYA